MVLMFFTNAGKSQDVKNVLYPCAWYLTNCGFFAVIYSRLHLLADAPRTLKWLAYGLVGVGLPFMAFLCVASTGIPFHLGMATHNVAYRLETLVSFAEIGFSISYIYLFWTRFMRNKPVCNQGTREQIRWTFIVLVLGETFVVAGYVVIITVWLSGFFLVRLAIAPLIYGTKLKVEFLILNRLTGMTMQRAELRSFAMSASSETHDVDVEAAAVAANAVLDRTQGGLPLVEEQRKSFDEATTAVPSPTLIDEPALSSKHEYQHSPRSVDASHELQRSASLEATERQYLGPIVDGRVASSP
jgi:hypothetical protein